MLDVAHQFKSESFGFAGRDDVDVGGTELSPLLLYGSIVAAIVAAMS